MWPGRWSCRLLCCGHLLSLGWLLFPAGPGNKVCYYYGNDAVYEELGHAEVVSMELRGSSKKAEDQMRVSPHAFCTAHMGPQCKCTVRGMPSGRAAPAACLRHFCSSMCLTRCRNRECHGLGVALALFWQQHVVLPPLHRVLGCCSGESSLTLIPV